MNLRRSAFLLISAASLQAAEPRFVEGRVLLLPKVGEGRAAIAPLRHGHTILKRLSHAGGLEVVRLGEGESVADAVAAYRNTGRFSYVEPDYLLREAADPDDPNYTTGLQWGLKNIGIGGGFVGADIHASGGWDVLSDTGEIIVGVVDGGARMTHEDLAPNLWTNPSELAGNGLDDDKDGYVDDIHGINAINPGLEPFDERGHGTHVAGIIGAAGNNGVGVSGVAWKTRLMILKFIDASGNGAVSDAVECIDFARTHGAAVINASWSGGSESTSLRQALQRASGAGMIVSNAAGNSSDNNDITPSYPGEYGIPNLLVVAATTRQDRFDSTYSNFGARRVHLGAPGTSIYSTIKDTDHSYGNQSGTSMSCAFVSGAAALLRARFPGENGAQAVYRILATVDPLADMAGRCTSGGRLNLKRALGPSLLVLPETTRVVSVRSGLIPAAVSNAFAFTNLAPVQVGWSVQSSVPWLAPDADGGDLGSHQAGSVGFGFTPAAASLAPGSYIARLNFSSGYGGEASFRRSVELRVLDTVLLEVSIGGGNQAVISVKASGGPVNLVTEASFNLIDWSPVQTNSVAASATIPVLDAQMGSFPRRFYRVRETLP